MKKHYFALFLLALSLIFANSFFAVDEAMAKSSNKKPFDQYPRPRVVTDRPLKVAYVGHPPMAEAAERSIKQLKIEAAHYGWDLTMIECRNPSENRDGIISAINLGVDAIHLGNLESMQSMQDLVARARKAGIGVYNNDNQLVDGVIGNSTMPNGVASTLLIYKIGEDNGWKGKVAYMESPYLQTAVERIQPVLGVAKAYDGWDILEVTDVSTWPGGPFVASSEMPVAWLEKYGHELDGMFCTADFFCFGGAEAAKAKGYSEDAFWAAGIDGGSDAFAYIRNRTTFKYTYAQAFEAYTHYTNQMIHDIQVKGLNPGDEGCVISRPGQTIYTIGVVVTRDNVPNVGDSIHTIYDYYDPDAKDVWYKWMDKGGPYIISEGGVQE